MNNVIEKLKKLLALAQSPNENEAAVAMAQAIRIAQRENVNLDSIRGLEFDEPVQENDGWAKSRFEPWERHLLLNIAEMFGCKIIQGWKFAKDAGQRDQVHMIVVGRPSDSEIVLYLTDYLHRQLTALWKRRKDGILWSSLYSPSKTRTDYLFGATRRILEKVKAMYQADTTEQEQKQEYGLILKRTAAVELFMSKMDLTQGRKSSYRVGRTARSGYSDADSISIHHGVASSGKQTVMIG
jgi:hypothetical protein